MITVQQMALVEWLRSQPDGVTAEQMAKWSGNKIASCSERLSRLKRRGLVAATHGGGSIMRWTVPELVEGIRARINAETKARQRIRRLENNRSRRARLRAEVVEPAVYFEPATEFELYEPDRWPVVQNWVSAADAPPPAIAVPMCVFERAQRGSLEC